MGEQALTLGQLQELARKADPRAQIAYAQLEAAQGKRDEANWIWFPDFQTTLAVAGPTPEARLKNGNDDALEDITDGTRKGLLGGVLGVGMQINTSATLPIYTFGKIGAGQRAAGHGVQAREALLDGSRNQAAFDVAKAYWSYQTTRDAQKSLDEMRSRIAEAHKQAQRLLDDKSEQLTASDVSRLDYVSEEIEAQSGQALAQQRLAEVALRLLVGRSPDEPLAVVREPVPSPPALPDLDALVAQARAHRPDLRAAEENVEAREALLELERDKYYPDLAVVGGFTFADTTNASNPSSPFAYDPYHAFGGYVALAVRGTFDIPQKMARVRQVEAQLHEALATRTGAERLVRLELEQARGELVSASVRAQHYVSGAATAKKLLIKGALAFDSGLGQAFDLMIDALLYSRAESARLQALLDAQLAWAGLERAVGAPLAMQTASPTATPSASPAATPAASPAATPKP